RAISRSSPTRTTRGESAACRRHSPCSKPCARERAKSCITTATCIRRAMRASASRVRHSTADAEILEGLGVLRRYSFQFHEHLRGADAQVQLHQADFGIEPKGQRHLVFAELQVVRGGFDLL